MNNQSYLLLIVLCLFGCDSEFSSKEQAKNEINSEGYRQGRWIDYLDADENKTLYIDEAMYYLLSEFSNGSPTGGYRLYNLHNEILRSGSFENDAILFDKFNLPNISVKGTTIYFENGKMVRKKIVNDKMLPDRTIDYLYDNELDRVDSFIVDWAYYPEDKTKTITFSNAGKSRIIIRYDESQWSDHMNYGLLPEVIKDSQVSEKLGDDFFKGKFPTEIMALFQEIISDISLSERINSITDGVHTVVLKDTFQEELEAIHSYKTIPFELDKEKQKPRHALAIWWGFHESDTFEEMSKWIKIWEEHLTHDLLGSKKYKNHQNIEKRKLQVLEYYFADDIVSLRKGLRENALEKDLSKDDINKLLNDFDLAYKRILNVLQNI